MYKVIKQFKDLKDGEHLYKVGDEYPRSGAKVSEARLEELASSTNRRGEPLIAYVEEPKAEEQEEVEKTEKKEPVKKAAKKTAKK